ncbi:hypothetical protein HQH61_25185 [Escherichia coli]|nr:hypothetical protein [Escherichia coli]
MGTYVTNTGLMATYGGQFTLTGMVAGEAIIISITGGFWFGLLMASFHWWRRKVNRLPPWDDV